MLGGLRYIGNGGFIPDIPARDLTEAEVQRYGRTFLLRTGLYRELTVDDLGGSENKLNRPPAGGKEKKK